MSDPDLVLAAARIPEDCGSCGRIDKTQEIANAKLSPRFLAEWTRDVVKEVMERAAAPAVTLSTPLVVDAGIGTTWNAAH